MVMSIAMSLLTAISPLIAMAITKTLNNQALALMLIPITCLGVFALAMALPSYLVMKRNSCPSFRFLLGQDLLAVVAGLPMALCVVYPASLLTMPIPDSNWMPSKTFLTLPFSYFASAWFLHCRLVNRMEGVQRGFSRELWTVGGVVLASLFSAAILFFTETNVPKESLLGRAFPLFSSAFLYVALPMIAFVNATNNEPVLDSDD